MEWSIPTSWRSTTEDNPNWTEFMIKWTQHEIIQLRATLSDSQSSISQQILNLMKLHTWIRVLEKYWFNQNFSPTDLYNYKTDKYNWLDSFLTHKITIQDLLDEKKICSLFYDFLISKIKMLCISAISDMIAVWFDIDKLFWNVHLKSFRDIYDSYGKFDETHVELMKFMINSWLDINTLNHEAKEKNIYPFIVYVILSWDYDLFDLCIKRWANINQQIKYDLSWKYVNLLDCAIRWWNIKIINRLWKMLNIDLRSNPILILSFSAKSWQDVLFDHYFNEKTVKDNDRLIEYAIIWWNQKILRRILEAFWSQIQWKLTLKHLWVCIINSNYDLVDLLQEFWLDINIVNEENENCLHYCIRSNKRDHIIDNLSFLLDKWVCINIVSDWNSKSWTPLMLAIKHKKIDICKFLIKKWADVTIWLPNWRNIIDELIGNYMTKWMDLVLIDILKTQYPPTEALINIIESRFNNLIDLLNRSHWISTQTNKAIIVINLLIILLYRWKTNSANLKKITKFIIDNSLNLSHPDTTLSNMIKKITNHPRSEEIKKILKIQEAN